MGQVMRKTGGRANPKNLEFIVERKIVENAYIRIDAFFVKNLSKLCIFLLTF